ncbi:hypothetical protein Z517_11381 [Fonsecaea pedrosoi CBS 271.37]|uniref:Phytanoyl-CoA dioxygenase n=1 Tax=Fonsecaea pedrosoi CBS 271.37 TaxID=1442368 RepID=A0A0D2DAK3_9EURO|nr:uncharacterized protein Z517_11381 [Fonsecaea pedrosoi CBS 271.37]KIW74611.1 hypothetical protein Z517_11381 [Fonsecaea pedrosoi CBS 271.37]
MSTTQVLRVVGCQSRSQALTDIGIQRVARTTPVSEIGRIIQDDGAVVIKQFLSTGQADRINEELDPHLEALIPSGQLVDLNQDIKDFLGHHTKRLTDLLQLSKTWREEVINDDLMHGISDEVLRKQVGDYWMSTATMMEIGPGNPLQKLHRDFGNWWPSFMLGKDAPELMLNFLMATNQTTVENGATRAIPGSHKWDYSAADHNVGDESQAVAVELEKGDCLIIGGKIAHGGGCNQTKDYLRRVIACVMVTSAFTPEEAFSHTVPLELARSLPERVQKILGFRSQWPQGSPGLWSRNADDIGRYLGLMDAGCGDRKVRGGR